MNTLDKLRRYKKLTLFYQTHLLPLRLQKIKGL